MWTPATSLSFIFNIYFYLFIRLHWVLAVVCGIFLIVASGIFICGMQTLSWGIWGLVPWQGIAPRPPALGVWSLSPWTIWEFQPPALSMSHNIRKEEILWLWCTLLELFIQMKQWGKHRNKEVIMSTFLVPVLHPRIWLITLLITGVNHGGLGCGFCSPDL